MQKHYLIEIFSVYRRRFQDSDMQSLLDFLEKNRDVASLSLAYNEINLSFTKLVDYLKVCKTKIGKNKISRILKVAIQVREFWKVRDFQIIQEKSGKTCKNEEVFDKLRLKKYNFFICVKFNNFVEKMFFFS